VAVGAGVGVGASTIAYSYDGINWFPSTNGTATLGGGGFGVAWNGTLWVAVGINANSGIAYSHDGITWIGVTTTIFSMGGINVAWNGLLWIAIGSGTNSIAYSYDGMNWTGLGFPVFTSGNGIAWNGTMWVATGLGAYSTAYSYDGFNWTGVPSSGGLGQGVAFNNRRPYTLTFPTNSTSSIIGTVSSSVSFPISVLSTSRLDVVSDAYYNSGYTNFSITMNASRS
jgi:hypothetical protein